MFTYCSSESVIISIIMTYCTIVNALDGPLLHSWVCCQIRAVRNSYSAGDVKGFSQPGRGIYSHDTKAAQSENVYKVVLEDLDCKMPLSSCHHGYFKAVPLYKAYSVILPVKRTSPPSSVADLSVISTMFRPSTVKAFFMASV